MPLIELLSMAVLMVYGSGEKRSSVLLRLIFNIAWVSISGFFVYLGLVAALDSLPLGGLAIAGIAAFLCYMSASAALFEFEKLLHWGEPQLVASQEGLLVTRRQRLIPWHQVTNLTPLKRGLRIDVADRRKVFIRSATPQKLSSAIREQMDLQGRTEDQALSPP